MRTHNQETQKSEGKYKTESNDDDMAIFCFLYLMTVYFGFATFLLHCQPMQVDFKKQYEKSNKWYICLHAMHVHANRKSIGLVNK